MDDVTLVDSDSYSMGQPLPSCPPAGESAAPIAVLLLARPKDSYVALRSP